MATSSSQKPPAPESTITSILETQSHNEKEAVEENQHRASFWKRTFSRKKPDADTEHTDKDKEPPVPSVPFPQLFRFSTKWELFLDFIGLLCAMAAGASQPLMTLLFGNLTGEFVTFGAIALQMSQDSSQVDPATLEQAAQSFRRAASNNALYFVYLGVGMFVTTYVFMYIWVYTGEVNAKRIRERYLKAVLNQDIEFFDNVGAGEVATRIQTDTHLIQQGISEKVPTSVQFLSTFAAGFIMAYARGWRLALALSAIIPGLGLSGALMSTSIKKYKQQSLQHIASAGTLAEEVISTIRTAQAFGMQKVLADLYNVHALECQVSELNSAVWSGAGFAVMFFIIYGSYGLAFSFGTTLINRGQATPGEVINVFFSILIGFFSLALLAPEAQAITNACAAAAKVFATINSTPLIDPSSNDGAKPDTVLGTIELSNVKFRYPSRPTVEVLKGLSVTFKAGKTTALVGASGSGKSTIISLIERFYDPSNAKEEGDKGSVSLDGNDLKTLNVKWLRSQIGLVSQEPVLFNTTIKENVAYGLIGSHLETCTEEQKIQLIQEACQRANAHDFISALPSGYDTQVGERGFLLSGGQKQRIAIARAIISNPKILLLDEATSALDTQSEGVVQDALDKAKVGRTTVVIAHRLSTVKDADVIYVLGEGMLVESGSHTELLERGGAYRRLVEAQQLRETRTDGVNDESSGTVTPMVEETDEGLVKKRGRGASIGGASVASSRFKDLKKPEDTTREYGLGHISYRLAMLVRENWTMYGFGTIAAGVTGAVYPVYGIVFSKGIDVFSYDDPGRRRFEGDRVALWFFVMGIVATIALGIQTYLFGATGALLATKLRILGFKNLLRQDVEYFDRDENTAGGLTANLSENPQKVNGVVGVTLGMVIQSISTLVIGIIIGLTYIWKVGLVGLACAPFLISVGFIRLRVLVQRDEQNKAAHNASAQLACEAAGTIRTVASLTLESHCLDQYSQSLEIPRRNSNKTSIWSHALFAFSQASAFWVIGLVFWYGATLVSRLEATVFEFFVSLMSITFGAMQAGNVFAFVPDISTAKGATTSLLKLMDSTPEIDADSSDGLPVNSEKSEGHIRFKDVHFWYPTRPGARVLRGINLDVKPGTYVALVGASGSGKSTVIQLLERFYDPISGGIYLDGGLISEFNVQDYRKQIALVSQEPTLYAGSIRFNVLLGATKPRGEVTQSDIEEACRDANILDFINGLPDGFDTQVGSKGMQLSGGQKQRIAIARALLRKPKVLLLDEATSALDSNSEKIVQEALDQAAKGRTTIAIAHRLSTIQNADCIYFIKNGRVSEAGTHDELIKRMGDYYRYVQLQGLSKRT